MIGVTAWGWPDPVRACAAPGSLSRVRPGAKPWRGREFQELEGAGEEGMWWARDLRVVWLSLRGQEKGFKEGGVGWPGARGRGGWKWVAFASGQLG